MVQNIIGDSDSDVSFKINGVTYELHKSVITTSLFFKALLDNEQYMGIKSDEIIINDIHDLPINSDYVYEILGWLYHKDTQKMSKFMEFSGVSTTDSLIDMLQYYTLIDFFQIDGLAEICKTYMLHMMVAIHPLPTNKIKHTGEYYNCDGSGDMYCCDRGEYSIDNCDEDLWKYNKKDFKLIAKIIYDQLAFIKKYVPIYFDRYIDYKKDKNIISDCGLFTRVPVDIAEHIINSIQHNNVLKFGYDKKKKLIYLTDNTGHYINGVLFIGYIYKIYRTLYRGVKDKIDWVTYSEKNALSIEIVDKLMGIFPDSDYPIMLLDTSEWQTNGTLNWNNISRFEKLCISHNKLECFKNKLNAYTNLCYF